MEAVVDFLYKDDCRAVNKTEDREVVADGALHRGRRLLVSRDGEAWTSIYQQGKAPRANSKASPTDLIKRNHLPHIHRAGSTIGDSKGSNFGVLQVAPNGALTLVHKSSSPRWSRTGPPCPGRYLSSTVCMT